ncbi:MAG: transcription antitermination factor NusB [Myxococcota bacterium]
MNSGARRKGREAALQMLYQSDLSRSENRAGVSDENSREHFWKHLAASRDGEAFATEIVRGFHESAEEIDKAIRAASHHWRLERMERVDLSILRLATFELLKLDDVPSRVTLNEAIELAKRFGSEGSPGFINGILDRIASDLGKD